MINFRWYRSGALFGMRYEMEQGDEIPQHVHDDSTLHNIIVLHGLVALHQGSEYRTLLMAGIVQDFDGRQPHLIRCMSDRAVILNMFLNGIPPGYAELPASEHQGRL
jgi:quercetin dioxygenase-like cupin family protein